MTYSVVNNSLCNNIAEMHLERFSNRSKLQLMKYRCDFANNVLGKLFGIGLVIEWSKWNFHESAPGV